MAENENVLQRSMFNAAPSTSAVSPTIGIPSVRSPAQTANELRNMFAPQPVQSFQDGGLVRPQFTRMTGAAPLTTPVADVSDTGLLQGSRGNALMRLPEYLSQIGTAGGGALEGLRDRFLSSRGVPTFNPPPPVSVRPPDSELMSAEAGSRSSADELSRMRDVDRSAESDAYMGRPAPAPAPAATTAAERPAPERQKGALELTLDGIKAERARSAEDKKQNALLALMQAGFAIAAGRSPSAIANIGAGAQAGIASFANMEKERRADDAALRREQTAILLERERMRAQEERQPEAIRTYASLGGWDPSTGREGFNEAVRRGIEVTKTLEKEPETVRLFKALGGGDLIKGFEIYNGDKKLQAAQAILKDITATEDDKKAANEYIRGQLARARTGGGGFAGFSATPVR